MNTSPSPEIRIMKPFEDGYTIMKTILFQPFELTKWLVIGFAAFIAGHFTAGGGFSPPTNFQPRSMAGFRSDATGLDFHHNAVWLSILIVGLVIFCVFVLVLMWVKARGIFVFTDCIVRNRAAIKEPWREFRREGNSFFLFYLCLAAVFIAVVAVIVGACVLVAALGHFSKDQGIVALIIVAVIGFTIYICAVVSLALIGYFMPMVMYRRRCLSLEAFKIVMNLIWQDPGPFTLFALFGIVLFLGMLMVASVVTCATCCVALLPYVGTVLMLPVFIWLRSFGLLFFRQFGPDCDVWSGALPIPPPLPPAPVATT
jgi:hypothetical protein